MGDRASLRKAQLAYELQSVDSALDQARHRLSEVEVGLADRAELDQALADQDAASGSLRTVEHQEHDLEVEVDDIRERLRALERKLYGGTVTNPKELDGLFHEADQFRRQISVREDRALALIDDIEAAAERKRQADAAAEAATAAHENRTRELETERSGLVADISRLERERDEWRNQMEPALLRIYDSLQRTKNGLAVSTIQQRSCQGCRVSLPVNEAARARTSEELVLCQSCGRILYVDLYG